jgi:hypothetical protein
MLVWTVSLELFGFRVGWVLLARTLHVSVAMRAVKSILRRVFGPSEKQVEPALVMSLPSAQNALDTFEGEWISAPPPTCPGLVAGHMPLFEDSRVAWALDQLGGCRHQRVLELGPLEAGHSFMLQHGGARSVLAIEGNQRCYLKCLVMKEIADLHAVHFELGNFIEFLRQTSHRFDLCLASGVLYHMSDPLELLHRIGSVADRVYIWTHYYDEARVKITASARHFSGAHTLRYGDFTCTAHRYEYFTDSRLAKYAGGMHTHSHWLAREDILRCLRHVGYTRIETAHEELEHMHGPCFTVAASR